MMLKVFFKCSEIPFGCQLSHANNRKLFNSFIAYSFARNPMLMCVIIFAVDGSD